MACRADPAPLWGFYLTYHLLAAGMSKQMLLQQRQPPPPASSGEMNGSSEGAQGRAGKSLGAAGPPTWLLQMLPLGHPKHDHVHNYSWASPTRSLICFCLHKKLFPQLQMECLLTFFLLLLWKLFLLCISCISLGSMWTVQREQFLYAYKLKDIWMRKFCIAVYLLCISEW